jgi:hypothetical protein
VLALLVVDYPAKIALSAAEGRCYIPVQFQTRDCMRD